MSYAYLFKYIIIGDTGTLSLSLSLSQIRIWFLFFEFRSQQSIASNYFVIDLFSILSV